MEFPKDTIFTIGHSMRGAEEFIAMLDAFGIRLLADIRTVPRSRHNPQFNSEALADALTVRGIGYIWLKDLGGLRHARKDSPNTGWRNGGFRGYADYMQTEVFEKALGELMRLAKKQRAAIMCAEAVPWRCHRSLVADALMVRGIPVAHIMSETTANPHKLTNFAHVEGEHITYPPPPDLLTGLG